MNQTLDVIAGSKDIFFSDIGLVKQSIAFNLNINSSQMTQRAVLRLSMTIETHQRFNLSTKICIFTFLHKLLIIFIKSSSKPSLNPPPSPPDITAIANAK